MKTKTIGATPAPTRAEVGLEDGDAPEGAAAPEEVKDKDTVDEDAAAGTEETAAEAELEAPPNPEPLSPEMSPTWSFESHPSIGPMMK